MAILTKEIFELAEQRSFGTSYPVYVNNLREIGVTRYQVDVASGDRYIFTVTHEPVLELPGAALPVSCAEPFSLSALTTALQRTQSGQSDYPTFMREIAAAGIHQYTADLLNRTVTYFGKNPSDKYTEKIPNPSTEQ